MPDELVALATSRSDDLRAAKQALSARLLGPRLGTMPRAFGAASPAPAANVVGVGIGEKHSAGQPTGVLAVKLFVRHKYPAGQLGPRDALPERVDGLPTDVEEVGTFQSFQGAAAPAAPPPYPNPRAGIRPVRPGSSIGTLASDEVTGTFGALVTDGTRRCILSNNHVLADEDRLPAGAPIIQPGAQDGGEANSGVIARFSRAVPLRPGAPNDVDAALAALDDPGSASPEVLFIGAPAGVGQASMDMIVHKFGRTTAYTVGRVTSVDTDITIQYPMGNLLFREQIVVVGATRGAFSLEGDSGSLIMERGTNRAVALLIAGSASHTIANPLQKVLDALGVTLV